MERKLFVIFDVMDTLFSQRKGLYEDVKKTLSILKKNGIFLGIISTLPKEDIEDILSTYNIKEMFDVIISVRDYDTMKPDPKLINIALTLLKDKYDVEINKKNVYYVGDRPDVDVRMANLAGITSVRIIRGKYAMKEEEDELERPVYKIYYLTELGDILGVDDREERTEPEDVEII